MRKPLQKFKIFLLAAACLLVQANPALADTSHWLNLRDSLRDSPPREALAKLKKAQLTFGQLADYHYWLGVLLQKEGQNQEAANEYELATLLDPNHAGALFDFSLLQCRLGETHNCQTLLEAAQQRFGSPPILQTAQLTRSPLQGQIRVGLGYSNNYNQGLSSQYIPLSIGGTMLDFEVAPSYRPYKAAYHTEALDLVYRNGLHPSFEASAHLQLRGPLNAQPSPSTSENYQLAFMWHASPTYKLMLNLKTQQDSKQGSLSVTGLGLQYRMPTSPIEPQENRALQGWLEQRQPNDPLPAYKTLTMLARWDGLRMARTHMYMHAGLEKDLPENLRPGRSQTRLLLSSGVDYPNTLFAKGLTRLSIRVAQVLDDEPYSPLFGDTRRQSLQVESVMGFIWPLDQNRSILSELRHSTQQSNLALFNQSETQLNIALAIVF